jgi:hypothetical protein
MNLLCSDTTRTDRNTALHYTRLVPTPKPGAAATLVATPVPDQAPDAARADKVPS